MIFSALDKYFSDVFNLQLPSFDPDNQTLEDFVDAIEAMIQEKGRFTFSKEVCLGLFSFAKINMYRDLQENEEKIDDLPNALNEKSQEIAKKDINVDLMDPINTRTNNNWN